MKKARHRKKYSLVFATVVAMLSVCTAGVSTFAWFQANAEVSVSSTYATTTITVADPNQTFAQMFVYADNYTDTGTGADDSHRRQIVGAALPTSSSMSGMTTFDGMQANPTYFKPLDSTAPGGTAYCTAISSFLPGQTVHFALLVSCQSTKTIALKIAGWNSSHDSHRKLYNDGSKTFCLANAINIYSTVISGTYNSGTKAFSGAVSDIKAFLSKNNFTALEDKCSVAVGDSLSTSYPITLSTTGSATQAALFLYRIEFDDSESAHYVRKTALNSETTADTSPTSLEWGADTFWKQDSGGNSEVFQGLPFQISKLTITES